MPTATTARHLALAHLLRIETGGAFIGQTGYAGSDSRMERQATNLVASITRWRRYLDFLIAALYSGSFRKMEPPLKQALRIGCYELLLQKKPAHAVLYETVELAKQLVRPDAGRLVNGILRALLRKKDALPTPDTKDVAEKMGILHSHPTWIVRRWLHRFGADETQSLLAWNNTRPVYSVRCNLLKTPMETFRDTLRAHDDTPQPGRYLDDFVRTERLQPLLHNGLLQDGICAVQDESAGLVVHLLDPQPGETIIDACAAPGGKTLYMAMQMKNQGRILALDIHAARLRLLQKAAAAHGLTIIETLAEDLRFFAADPQVKADRVLLDTPCSGLGVLAKRADLRWRRKPEQIKELCMLQDDLLQHAARLVKPGGLLVYSTCSTETEENEQRIQSFLRRHPTFQLEKPSDSLPSEVITPSGFLATLPQRHAVDGAFGARLRKSYRVP